MPHDDLTLLRHMIEAAEAAMQFASGRTREDLDTDLEFVFALVRAIEIVGEAAGRVSETTRSELPQLPWQSMVGMRNKLVHAYFDVELDVVWATVENNLLPLIQALTAYVKEADGES